ncbi:MAG: putative toxin-antitoxin system toxin component, PIN family [Proteobacteria bacterium]|nr:putative toxin-antitoxin system toxin component, PIN family [Pseudomonadota bacterium]
MHQETDTKTNSNIYIVIDTNVIVSALWSKKADSPTVRIIEALFDDKFIPLYHPDIIAEYIDVLYRDKFGFSEDDIICILAKIQKSGEMITPEHTDEIFRDRDDVIFYEVVMSKHDDNAWLVTGNLKHYPQKEFIVTPKDMMDILDAREHAL